MPVTIQKILFRPAKTINIFSEIVGPLKNQHFVYFHVELGWHFSNRPGTPNVSDRWNPACWSHWRKKEACLKKQELFRWNSDVLKIVYTLVDEKTETAVTY